MFITERLVQNKIDTVSDSLIDEMRCQQYESINLIAFSNFPLWIWKQKLNNMDVL